MRYTIAINAICFQIGHSCSNGIFLIKIIRHCVGCVLLNISGAATNCYKRNRGGSRMSLTKCSFYVILQIHDKLSAIQFERMWMEETRWRCDPSLPWRSAAKWNILRIFAVKRVEIDCLFQFLNECKRIQTCGRKSICCRLKLKYGKELACIA